MALAVFTAVAGALFCFFGYRLLRFAVPLLSFLAGFTLCGMFLPNFANLDNTKLLIFSVMAGGACSAISAIFIKVCVFLGGGYAGFMVFRLITRFFPAVLGDTSGTPLILVGLLFFGVCGALALKLKKPVLTAFTAYTGAYLIVSSLASFAGYSESVNFTGPLSDKAPWFLFALAAFTIAGFIAQRKVRLRWFTR